MVLPDIVRYTINLELIQSAKERGEVTHKEALLLLLFLFFGFRLWYAATKHRRGLERVDNVEIVTARSLELHWTKY